MNHRAPPLPVQSGASAHSASMHVALHGLPHCVVETLCGVVQCRGISQASRLGALYATAAHHNIMDQTLTACAQAVCVYNKAVRAFRVHATQHAVGTKLLRETQAAAVSLLRCVCHIGTVAACPPSQTAAWKTAPVVPQQPCIEFYNGTPMDAEDAQWMRVLTHAAEAKVHVGQARVHAAVQSVTEASHAIMRIVHKGKRHKWSQEHDGNQGVQQRTLQGHRPDKHARYKAHGGEAGDCTGAAQPSQVSRDTQSFALVLNVGVLVHTHETQHEPSTAQHLCDVKQLSSDTPTHDGACSSNPHSELASATGCVSDGTQAQTAAVDEARVTAPSTACIHGLTGEGSLLLRPTMLAQFIRDTDNERVSLYTAIGGVFRALVKAVRGLVQLHMHVSHASEAPLCISQERAAGAVHGATEPSGSSRHHATVSPMVTPLSDPNDGCVLQNFVYTIPARSNQASAQEFAPAHAQGLEPTQPVDKMSFQSPSGRKRSRHDARPCVRVDQERCGTTFCANSTSIDR